MTFDMLVSCGVGDELVVVFRKVHSDTRLMLVAGGAQSVAQLWLRKESCPISSVVPVFRSVS